MSLNSPVNLAHTLEMHGRQRFAFGKNWESFLLNLTEQRVVEAENSLKAMLEVNDLHGKSFLDVGCGSGLFSLAAMRLGASVVSFDYDPQSVVCTTCLKQRYFKDDSNWTIQQASALDIDYLSQLGEFDVVYSWGVLHHTGAMWDALKNTKLCVAKHGQIFISLYNDQGWPSTVWTGIKKAYVRCPRPLRFLIFIPCFLRLWGPATIRDIVFLRPFSTWRQYHRNRGMSPYHDAVDWVGGFPFEVSKPEQVFNFYKASGFALTKLKTVGGRLGCNEFVFERL